MLFWLDTIEPEDQLQVGEQALHLSLLAKKNYAVLPSLVVPASLFREFLESLPWLEPFFSDLPNSSLRFNVEDSQQLQAIARQIRNAILQATLPEGWITTLLEAVRTFPKLSAEAQAVVLSPSLALKAMDVGHTPVSLSTEVSSLLEAQFCPCDRTDLERHLKQLWAEPFRARNLVYWQKANISWQQLNFAVLVQPIATPIAAGYLQPAGNNWDIVATSGLEVAIARGEVLPDLYHLEFESEHLQLKKHGHQTIQYSIQAEEPPLQRVSLNQKQTSLSKAQFQNFVQLTHHLSQDFQMPLRVEWQLYRTPTDSEQLYCTRIHYQDRSLEPVPEPIADEVAPIVAGLAAAQGSAIGSAFVWQNAQKPPMEIPSGCILVTSMISPDWLPHLKQAAAIVSERGGITSHGAIIARELGIPAVVSARHALKRIRSGDWIRVDGDRGQVYSSLPPQAHSQSILPVSLPPIRFPMPERSPIATRLMVNLSQPSLIDEVALLDVDGVGLLRSELMMLEILDQQHPQYWLQQHRQSELIERLSAQLHRFAKAFAPNPVFYRSLDLRSHEFAALKGSGATPSGANPMLGMRGTLSYLHDSALFELELSALRRVMGEGSSNLRLILPFVRTAEEFRFCRQQVEQAGLLQNSQFQLWIMAEVPSVIFLLPEYVRAGVEGICIGTSDLTQLMLGIDRDHGLMPHVFSQIHPAVITAIAQLIQQSQALGIPCSISSQATLEPEVIDRLIEWGITAISVNVDVLESTQYAIARSEQRVLLRQARNR